MSSYTMKIAMITLLDTNSHGHQGKTPSKDEVEDAYRGVLLASRNDALFLKDGKDVFIPGKDLFDNFQTEEIENLGSFEKYPNRNSKQYIDIYGIKDTQTMIRGTYRYKG